MQKLDRKNAKQLTYLCAAAYFVSYLTRVNFAAVIAAIIQAGDIDKTSAGLVTTLGFITYGVGQLISGWLGDRINPKRLMVIGFSTTVLMNMLIPLCPNGAMMCVVWAFNGFAQSFMWPPMVKIMSSAMDTDDYNKGCVVVSWGSTIATILIYLVSPLIISLAGWRAVFFVYSAVAIVISTVWYTKITAIEKKCEIVYPMHQKRKSGKKMSIKVSIPVLVIIMLAIMLQGSLRDGVTTWVPTFVSEAFNLGSEVSILSSVIIPIFSLASLQMTAVIYNKLGKKPFKSAGIFFSCAIICAVVLAFFHDLSVILTVVMSAVIVACMHGINLILVCFLPAALADDENVSTLSGVLNFMTYVGSAASTYGFALLSESFGWGGTVSSWLAITVLGTTACVICHIATRKIKL
ncbi:MAG: MFS transporter [Clostridia bacterium]|nr:MFS transporter [Clostridia bacterium]